MVKYQVGLDIIMAVSFGIAIGHGICFRALTHVNSALNAICTISMPRQNVRLKTV